ncbi:MAG: hypothetical protein KIH63_005915 [Candidatus Saccharibacteria bacterium]|nr:hypothetical protein [Candidatus Saccharibacteria bacterium]
MSSPTDASRYEVMQETLTELRAFDAEAGTRIGEVFELSVAQNQDLGGVYIMPFDDDELAERGLDFVPSLLSTTDGEFLVTLPTELEHLTPLMTGALSGRMAVHRQIVAQSRGFFELCDAANLFVAHELGHADHDIREIANFGLEEANRRHHQAYIEGMRSLPLGTETTQAMVYWEQNTGGYQTYLRRTGIDDVAFEGRLRQNVAAYGEIPMEAYADEFALGIVRQMYPPADHGV